MEISQKKMPNDFLETQILLHDDDLQVMPGEKISGQIIFTPKEDLNITEIGYQVVMSAEGKIDPFSKILTQQIFLKNETLKKGQNYNYNFEFISANPSSYDGENLDIIWKIESIVNLRTDSYLKVRNNYFKKNNLPFSHGTKTLLWHEGVFEVLESEQPYTVEIKNETIEITSCLPILIFSVISFIIILFLLYNDTAYQLEFTIGFAIVLCIFFILPYFYKQDILDKINVETKPLGNNQFVVNLDLSRYWRQIQKVKVNYSVHEEVMDRRDKEKPINRKAKIFQSSTIEKHKIKMSKKDILDFPEITYDFIFDFPKEHIPTTLKMYNLHLFWKVNISVYFFGGLKSTFVKNITVGREEINSENKIL